MTDPCEALQRALVRAWKASAPPVPLFDEVPAERGGSYACIYEIASQFAGADGYEAYNVTATLHVWTDGVGSVDAKAIARRLADTLVTDPEIEVAGFRVVINSVVGIVSGVAEPDRPDAVCTLRYKIQALPPA